MDGLYSDKVKILATFLLQSFNPFFFQGRKKPNEIETEKKIIESIFSFIYHVKQLLLNSKHFLAVQDFPSQCKKREKSTLNLEKLNRLCYQTQKVRTLRSCKRS